MQNRFGTLDLLRGIAAIAVVLLHAEETKLTGPLLPHAYLAVDFFFALSGFVIAYSYEDRLRDGLTPGAFLVRRAIRLYPMIMFGVCFGAAILALKLEVDPSRVDPVRSIVGSVITNLFAIPSPFSGAASRWVLFPCDGPLWSVSLEVLVNVIWCFFLVRSSTRTLTIIVGLCLLDLLLMTTQLGKADLGFDWMTYSGGPLRIGYGFGLGLLAYRWRNRIVVSRHLGYKLASILLLVGLFAVPRIEALEPGLDVIGITLVIPLVLLLGLNSVDHARLDAALGDMSYPLYAIHFPILLLASGLHQKVPHLNLALLLVGTACAMVWGTAIVMRLYDEPVRRALSSWWTARGRQTAREALVGTPPGLAQVAAR